MIFDDFYVITSVELVVMRVKGPYQVQNGWCVLGVTVTLIHVVGQQFLAV